MEHKEFLWEHKYNILHIVIKLLCLCWQYIRNGYNLNSLTSVYSIYEVFQEFGVPRMFDLFRDIDKIVLPHSMNPALGDKQTECFEREDMYNIYLLMLFISTSCLIVNVCIDMYGIRITRIMSVFITERHFVIFAGNWVELFGKVMETDTQNSCFALKSDYSGVKEKNINHILWTVSGTIVWFGLLWVPEDWMIQKLTIAEQSGNIERFLTDHQAKIRVLAKKFFLINEKTAPYKFSEWKAALNWCVREMQRESNAAKSFVTFCDGTEYNTQLNLSKKAYPFAIDLLKEIFSNDNYEPSKTKKRRNRSKTPCPRHRKKLNP